MWVILRRGRGRERVVDDLAREEVVELEAVRDGEGRVLLCGLDLVRDFVEETDAETSDREG